MTNEKRIGVENTHTQTKLHDILMKKLLFEYYCKIIYILDLIFFFDSIWMNFWTFQEIDNIVTLHNSF